MNDALSVFARSDTLETIILSMMGPVYLDGVPFKRDDDAELTLLTVGLHYNRALLNLHEERWEDALATHRLNVRRHPDHWRVYWNMGRALQATGERQAAIESYEKALDVDPFNNLASFQRARLEELRALDGQS